MSLKIYSENVPSYGERVFLSGYDSINEIGGNRFVDKEALELVEEHDLASNQVVFVPDPACETARIRVHQLISKEGYVVKVVYGIWS